MPPEPPGWMEKAAQDYWNDIAPTLPDGTLDRPGAKQAFTILCVSWEVWARLSIELVGKETITRAVPRGMRTEPNPALKALHDAHERYKHWSKQFGLDPLAHEKLRKAALSEDQPEGIVL